MRFRLYHLLPWFALLLAVTGASATMTDPHTVMDYPGAAHIDAGVVDFEAPLAHDCNSGRPPCGMHCPSIASSPAGLVVHERPAGHRTSEPFALAPAVPRARLLRPPIPA